MTDQKAFTLQSAQNGDMALKLFLFDEGTAFGELQRLSHYSVIVVTEGSGKLKADFSTYEFKENVMMCFAPYQPFLIESNERIKGFAVNFQPDFFCLYRHHKEIEFNGILFNNIYKTPIIEMASGDAGNLWSVFEKMQTEIEKSEPAQYEILICYLKIYLIIASRLRMEQKPKEIKGTAVKEPVVLKNLQEAIEQHFKVWHTASDYANLLNISLKTLAKISKTHFNKTLTTLIAERIVIEAKRELYMTSKTVKTIGYELGFNDEYYFSRFFKINAEVSPQHYRETVGFARGEE
ncbi:AraC-type DNA-binding protein [Pseudarcicella hirudinis]|uniref:AraC-type DNA-binding protein n=1 Tax=Pseudarcicella hirudinis TaxID=1079859 RepID=A0A1I5XAW5_9BACT|nr:helix-turn-helix domain-containing protein [Pseudarcicella hirudinis]SFQ29105.1 AraC-type DNA-binding protein [Pseudarcicella hirudinis]